MPSPIRTSAVPALIIGLVSCQTGPGATGPNVRGERPAWLSDCVVSGVLGWCGTYEVPEDRSVPQGTMIPLNVFVAPASTDTPEPDPLFFFMGGPGGGATAAAGTANGQFAAIRTQRDIVYIDQRGTGQSNPLHCSGGGPLRTQDYFDEFLDPDDVTACLAQHSADVSQYTTPVAMDDINEVRFALGYDRINLYGGSYGTRAALIYMRRHPATVRAAVLKGVAPTDMENPLPFAQAAERGMAAVLDACELDTACHGTFPNLRADWNATLAQFDNGPVTAAVVTGAGTDTVSIPRGVFADGLRHILYSMPGAARVPSIVHAAARGNFTPFAQVELDQSIGFSNLLAMGMFLTVTCAEDVQFISDADVARETANTFLGDYRVRRQRDACARWPAAGIDASYQTAVVVSAPTLIISGEVDTATPWEGGQRVADALPNARHFVVPNQSHDTVNPGCEHGLVRDFVSAGTTDGLDGSCLLSTPRPPFDLTVR